MNTKNTKLSFPSSFGSILRCRALACLLAGTGAFALSAPAARAALLVYEGFDYGPAGSNLDGTAAGAGTGLSGSWSFKSGGGMGNGSVYRQLPGLTFSNIPVTGEYLSSSSNWPAGAQVALGSVAQAATGTLYLSYLFRVDATGALPVAGTAYVGFNSSGQTSNTKTFLDAQAVSSNSTSSATGVTYGATYTSPAVSSQTLVPWTTYMVIAEFTNVGAELSAENPGVATLWVLTEAQYNYFLDNGGVTTSALNSASIGTGSTNSVTSRVSTEDTSGMISLSGASLQVYSSASTSTNWRIDEIRLATTLSDALTGTVVSAIPEPGTWGLLLGAASLLGAFVFGCRRRPRC